MELTRIPISVCLLTGQTIIFNGRHQFLKPVLLTQVYFIKLLSIKAMELVNPEPLIDCVADMQVIYRLDTNNDGTIDSTVNDISGLTAQQIRDRVKEVRVYILSHEGQSDRSFRFASSTITVGEFGVGRTFNLSATIGSGWENYRWKVSTLVVKPRNLAS